MMTSDEITFIRATSSICQLKGVYCSKCRFRMLPSSTQFDGDKMYYCIPCKFAIGVATGVMVSLLSLVKNEISDTGVASVR